MAGDIYELTREPLKKGRNSFRLLYLYPLDPIITITEGPKAGTKIIPQARTELPPEVEKYALIPEPWLAGIDAGDAYVIEDRLDQEDGESLPAVLVRIRARYAKGLMRIDQERQRWANAGRKFDP